MRILLLYDRLYPDCLGGIEHRNLELGTRLAERGHSVTLAGWGSGPNRRPHARLETRLLRQVPEMYGRSGRRRSLNALRFARDAARLDAAEFDLIETANLPFLHLRGLARVAGRRGIPLLVSWYEFWGDYWRDYKGVAWRLFAAIEKRSVALGDRLLVSCELTRSRLCERRRNEDIDLLPCGVDNGRVARAAERGRSREIALVPLLYAGRLQPEKRVDLLIGAVARLARQPSRSGPLLRIVGDGPEEATLRRLTVELGVADRVAFLGRLPDCEDVWEVMGASTIAVQPSEREGFGLFPLEAMAAGLPVVYLRSTESAVSELVREGREGIGVEGDEASLAAALGELLGDCERRQRYSDAAVLRARTFAWDKVAARAEALFVAAQAE